MLRQAQISFRKPDILDYHLRGFTVYDMHTHTNYSDGKRTVEQMLLSAKKKKVGICVADHNEIGGAMKAVKNTLGVPVIAGTELTTSEGMHILFYFTHSDELQQFYNQSIKNYRNPKHPLLFMQKNAEELIEAAQQYHC